MRLTIAAVLVCALVCVVGCGTQVPDVKGMTLDQAKQAMHSVGFTVTRVNYDANATGTPGAVVAQAPAAGQRRRRARDR